MTVFNTIDWYAMHCYTKNISNTKNTNLIKYVMDWQNDNRWNELFTEKDGVCSACGLVEDHVHFI